MGGPAFMTQDDIQMLKTYVTAPGRNGQNQAESSVRLNVTHSNLKAQFMEILLDLHMTGLAVKIKLNTHCGTAAAAMIVQLKDERGNLIATLADDRKLGFYSPYDGWSLHIIDTDPNSMSANGWLEDTSKVQKYVMSDEEYAKRDNTYRKYKDEKRRVDPEWTAEKELAMRRNQPYEVPSKKDAVSDPDYMADEARTVGVGSRCEVDPGGKRGVVRYVGRCEGLPIGYWVGVQYDEPVGKNDGSVKGKRYFDCPQGYGGMVRPNLVKVGDYPAIDEFGLSDEDEI